MANPKNVLNFVTQLKKKTDMKRKIDFQKIDSIIESNPNVAVASIGLIHNWCDTAVVLYFQGIRIYDKFEYLNNPNAIIPYEIDLPVLMLIFNDGHIETHAVYYTEKNTGGHAPNDDSTEGLRR